VSPTNSDPLTPLVPEKFVGGLLDQRELTTAPLLRGCTDEPDFFVYEDPEAAHRADLEAQRAEGPDHMTIFLTWLLACCTGGRPMCRMDGPPGFVESMTGAKKVHHWQDLFGRVWLAEDRWSWFRIPVESR